MDRTGYVTYRQVAGQAAEHYRKYHEKTGFRACVQYLARHGLCQISPPSFPKESPWSRLEDREFYHVLDSLPIGVELPENPASFDLIKAEYIMPETLEVYAIKYVRDIVERRHVHNFFEVNYVMEGSCRMLFENETRTMKAGQLCIIAPESLHDVTVSDESVVISFMMRQNTFDSAFFRLLTQEDLLAGFLRAILYSEKREANYILFTTDNSSLIKGQIKDIFMECYVSDSYSNTCVISRMHLFFSLLLRRYSGTIQCYEPGRTLRTQVSFPRILQYIQSHYRTVTLETLAEVFHYNSSYISRLIKMNTGHTLGELLTGLRMAHARELLLHSDLKIQEIAGYVGYDSTDHFSRKFKGQYGSSPAEYRKWNRTGSEEKGWKNW